MTFLARPLSQDTSGVDKAWVRDDNQRTLPVRILASVALASAPMTQAGPGLPEMRTVAGEVSLLAQPVT